MFFTPRNLTPTPAKRIIYIAAATILGLLLSLIAHAVIEDTYLNWAMANGKTIVWYSAFGAGLCALPPWLQIGLLLIGAVGGFCLGRLWYRMLYIDKIWMKHYWTK